MLVSKNGIEIPDECPKNCEFKDEPFTQGGTCYRCPVFNCKNILDENGNDFCLMKPEDYREDYALMYKKYFDSLKEKYNET